MLYNIHILCVVVYNMLMNKKTTRYHRGFTIVELLVVIVVIGILFSVGVAAYSGMQQKTRDTQRVSDIKTIVKALEMYKTQTGTYPPVSTGTNTISDWEVSSKSPDQFLSALKTAGVVSRVPVDPINTGTVNNGLLYRYYRYVAGGNGCPLARGAYYVLIVGDAETATQLDSSPGFQCSGRNWSTEGGYVTGAYTM